MIIRVAEAGETCSHRSALEPGLLAGGVLQVTTHTDTVAS